MESDKNFLSERILNSFACVVSLYAWAAEVGS